MVLNQSNVRPKFSAWVLIIDDNDEDRKLTSDLFKGYGCTVFDTESTDTALEMCKEVDYNIIISEIFLPTNKGFEFAKNIRNLPNGIHKYLVGYSRNITTKEIVMKCIESGMTDCMKKPINNMTIEARLHAWDIKKEYIHEKIIQSKGDGFGMF